MREPGTKPMPRPKRLEWIKDWLRAHPEEYAVDVLNADFGYEYAKATGMEFFPAPYGAPFVAMLGRDLSTLHKERFTVRSSLSISSDLAGMGFPRWVWSYRNPYTRIVDKHP